MTTTGTLGSSAAPAILSLALLAALLLAMSGTPAIAGQDGQTASDSGRPVLMPEPMTLVFVGVAGLAFFRKMGKQRLH